MYSQKISSAIPLLTALSIIPGTACTDDSEIGSDDESGTYNGVYVNCLNEDKANYWWGLLLGGGKVKLYGAYPETPANVCIGASNMGPDFDIVDDWDPNAYTFPTSDSEIRSLCSERCKKAHDILTMESYVCEDSNWSGHKVRAISYDPSTDPYNCEVAIVHPNIENDPYASNIDWNEGAPPALSIPLDCSLTSDCTEHFDADIDEWALAFASGGTSDLILENTRQASFYASTGVGGAWLELDMDSGDGLGYDDEHPLLGHAEYTPSHCANSTCPFYLGAFEAGNTSDDWEIYLDAPPAVSENKEVSNVQIEALQSSLAAWRPSTGQVAFPPGSLSLQVNFELSNDTCSGICSGFGNGLYSRSLVNSETVFGFFDDSDGSFFLDYSFPVINGTANLTLDLTADGHPPQAMIGLDSQARCNHADGYELSAIDSSTTDVDSDVDYLIWYVDGVVRPNGYVVPLGIHDVDLLAIDSRGAHDLAGEQQLEVVLAAPCL